MKHIVLHIAALLLLFIGAAPTLKAAPADYEQAYKKGDYIQAVELLQRTLAEQGSSSALFYDLGNAYSKAGNPGAAVLNYEKALRLDPGNAAARSNLHYTENMVQLANESEVGDRNLDPAPAPLSFTDSIRAGISTFSSNAWAVTSVMLFFLFIGCAVLYLFFSGVALRKVGFFGGGICLVLSLAAYCFSTLSRSDILAEQTAVLMQSQATLLSSPQADAKPVAMPLSSGTKFKVTGTQKADDGTVWTRLYLNSDYTGWLPASYVEIVRVPGLK